MGKKKKRIELFVYDPYEDDNTQGVVEPADQRLRVRIEKKHRGGKVVTIIVGYQGEGIEDLAKQLKSGCGVGGTAKDGEILLQGDHKSKVIQLLKNKGYGDVK